MMQKLQEFVSVSQMWQFEWTEFDVKSSFLKVCWMNQEEYYCYIIIIFWHFKDWTFEKITAVLPHEKEETDI